MQASSCTNVQPAEFSLNDGIHSCDLCNVHIIRLPINDMMSMMILDILMIMTLGKVLMFTVQLWHQPHGLRTLTRWGRSGTSPSMLQGFLFRPPLMLPILTPRWFHQLINVITQPLNVTRYDQSNEKKNMLSTYIQIMRQSKNPHSCFILISFHSGHF